MNIKYDGKEMPLSVFVWTVIIGIILTPIIAYAVLFLVPPLVTVMVLGYCAGKSIGKHKK